jgi:thioredoxin 1
MNQTWKVVIVVVLIVSVIAVLTIKRNKSEPATGTDTAAEINDSTQQARNTNEEQAETIDPDSGTSSEITASITDTAQPDQVIIKDLPMLLDLGSDECIPCKEMAPILEELKTEYAGKFKVEFLDVRKEPVFNSVYNIKLIPTQIFFDASGEELFRHEGFYSKNDILLKWKELGFEMTQTK